MERHNSNPELGSKPNGSSEKRATSFEEVSHLLSSHQTSKESHRRATSQIASPVVDFEVAVAEKPQKPLQGSQPEEGPKSYYVINPIVPGSAWYFTKGKSNSNTHEYEVERVSTHLVDIGQNRIGYLIETATRDDVTAVAGGRPESWSPEGQNGWSTTSTSSIEKANNTTEAEPGKRASRFGRFDSEGDFETQLHDESAIIVDRQDIPLITEMIFRQLNTTRLKRNSSRMIGGPTEKHEASSKENGELANIIEATLMAFRRPVRYDITPEIGEADISQSQLPVQFAMEHGGQRIKLQPSVVSDAENTLSIPKTSFTVANSAHKVNRAREKWQQGASSTSTTWLSQQSATSNTWTKHGGHGGESLLSPDSARSSSDENSEGTSQTRRTSSCRTHKQDEKLEASQASIGSSSVASTITSFPKLLSRHCTREWIKPLVSLEDKSTNPSHQGVDDGTNRISREPQTSFTEATDPMCWPGDSFQSINTSGYFTNEAPKSRRTTVSQSSPTNMKNFGSQIGSSAHRRRSTLTYDSKASPSTDHFFPNILGKFFVGRNMEEPETPDSKRTTDSDSVSHLNSPSHVQVHVGAP
ncbi:hypothetical protein T069G_02802 [Trichoderma breve]|uniref:Uncharacterized protein n=1 Tax=Trichoderma breve TaxID=2034170 RepID=A0A9W9BEJ1_9HYPO|nr:hypothetical protein T069G_02802 [Trichoderma breve]KAJ4861848.1 hypothetical protein T069G_02802 [Trichoderma breve]